MTEQLISAGVVTLKTITLALGGLITYFSYRAYRQTAARPIGALSLGFGLITLGALFAGVVHQGIDVDANLVLLMEGGFMAAGFAVIAYSLYADW